MNLKSDMRSPTFIDVGKDSSSSKEMAYRQKVTYAIPVRTCDMDLTMFGISSVQKTDSARKPKYAIPVRHCDMNLGIFEEEPAKKKKPVRKQLWSNEKKSTRFTTSIRPEKNNRKSIAKPLPSVQKVTEKNDSKKKLIRPSLKLDKTPKSERTIPKLTSRKPNNDQIMETKNKYDEMLSKLELKFNDMFNNLEHKIEAQNNEILNRLTNLELSINYQCKNCGSKHIIKAKEQKDENERSSGIELHEEQRDQTANLFEPLDLSSNSPSILQKDNNDNTKLIHSSKKNINKFEMLELRFKNGSPMSNEFSLSDTDSPAVMRKDINWLINDNKSPLYKSVSTSSIPSSKKKIVTFQSKSQSDLVYEYNEMRNNFNFLCTPKNTRTVSNLMTPSVQNSQKKMLSRQIQKQMLLLE